MTAHPQPFLPLVWLHSAQALLLHSLILAFALRGESKPGQKVPWLRDSLVWFVCHLLQGRKQL